MEDINWVVIFENLESILKYNGFELRNINDDIDDIIKNKYLYMKNNNNKAILIINPNAKNSNIVKKIDNYTNGDNDVIVFGELKKKEIKENIIVVPFNYLYIDPIKNININEMSIYVNDNIHKYIEIKNDNNKILKSDIGIFYMYPKKNDIILIREFNGHLNFRIVV